MIKKLLSVSFKNRINTFRFKGNNVECNICLKKFVTFLPSGLPLRANAICPNCESFQRTRIYWRYLLSLEDFFETKKSILHVAPQKALFKKFTQERNFTYCPIDKFEPGYSYPRATRNMDVLDLKYPDEHFDFILCSHVLEHVPKDVEAMKELYRVLSVNGFGIIQVPVEIDREKTYEDDTITDPDERFKAFGQFDHVRIYGMDYRERLESAGFIVEKNNYTFEMSSSDRFRHGFGAGETLYIVRKK